jgi:Spy/CpxP family protein refolding chaperone
MKWQSPLAMSLLVCLGGAARADWNPATRRHVAIEAMEKRAHLDETKAARVEDVVERYVEPMKSARQERRDAMRELRGLLRSGQPSEPQLRRLEQNVAQSAARLHQLEADRMRDLGKVLTPAELGRLMVSWRAINYSLRHGRV